MPASASAAATPAARRRGRARAAVLAAPLLAAACGACAPAGFAGPPPGARDGCTRRGEVARGAFGVPRRSAWARVGRTRMGESASMLQPMGEPASMQDERKTPKPSSGAAVLALCCAIGFSFAFFGTPLALPAVAGSATVIAGSGFRRQQRKLVPLAADVAEPPAVLPSWLSSPDRSR